MDYLQITITRSKDYFQLLKRRWWILAIFAVMVCILMLFNSLLKPSYYQATTTFHPVNESNPAISNSIGALFGGNLGSESDQLLTGVLESKYLSEAVVADTVDFGILPHLRLLTFIDSASLPTSDFRLLADEIIAQNVSPNNLTSYIKGLFIPPSTTKDYRKKILSASQIIRIGLKVSETTNGFTQLDIYAATPELAEHISRGYLSQINSYYDQVKTQKARRNLEFYTARSEKIKKDLDATTRSRASYQDRLKSGIFAVDRVKLEELLAREEILRQMYISLVLSKEQAEAQLQEVVPVIQVLDQPIPPFRRVSSSLILNGTVGIILGAFLGTLIVLRGLIFQDLKDIIRYFIKQATSGSTSQKSEDSTPEAF